MRVGSAVFSSMDRIDLAISFVLPRACNNNAAEPATNGAAIDEPDWTRYEPKATGIVERILAPGAVIAGLRYKSYVGPNELKEDARPPVGMG